VLPVVSNSTIFVILTLPTFQCIRRSPHVFVASSFLAAKMVVSARLAQWIISLAAAWWGTQIQERTDARTSHFGRKSGFSDRETREFDVKGAYPIRTPGRTPV